MLVRFSSGVGFSCRKRDKKVTREVAESKETTEDSVDVFKRLLPKGALDPWQEAIEAARKVHDDMTLPWRDDGYRLLRSDKFLAHSEAMRKQRALVEAERDRFIEAYPGYCRNAPDRLKQMYEARDFPSVEKLTKRFKFKVDVMPVPDGADFRVDLADEHLAAIRLQIDADTRANTLRPLLEPLSRMVERLAKPEQVFRDTLVTNIQDILKLIPEGDPEIDRLIERVKELTRHDAQVLRDSKSTRQATAVKANEILATMSGYFSGDATPPAAPLEMPEPEPQTAVLLPVDPPAPVLPPPVALRVSTVRAVTASWRRSFLRVPRS